jgi:dolichol-phosphate mannosyltransferase
MEWEKQMVRVFIVLPIYNEGGNLPELLKEFEEVFAGLGRGAEIVAVDDGSTDGTAEILAEASRRMPLRVVTHERNRGLGQAIKTGLFAAIELSQDDDDVIVNMDADNTHSPRYIGAMVRRIDEGADVVIASRYRKGSKEVGVPWWRRVVSRGARMVFRVFLNLRGVRDYTCGYRAYRAGLVREALGRFGAGIITRNGFACTDEILVNLASLTKKITEIPFVLRYDRKRGRSKMRLVLTAWETLKMLARQKMKR